jgi:DNA-3-methyladenine glycosylase II
VSTFQQIFLDRAVEHLKKLDNPTERLLGSIGSCKLKTIGSVYYVLIKSVISQQLSFRAAGSIQTKLFASLGSTSNVAPSPEAFLQQPPEFFRQQGLSLSKANTILTIANHYSSGQFSDESFMAMGDCEIEKALCSIKGIGPWTVEMVLIFSLARPDYFSVEDIGLRRGVEEWYKIDRNKKKEINEYMKKYSPYRSILSWYLWTYQDANPWE